MGLSGLVCAIVGWFGRVKNRRRVTLTIHEI
jgi:hypothetical protein